MKSVKHLLLTLSLIVAFVVSAQDKDRKPAIDDLHENKWQFLVDKAELTQDDIDKVKPVFLAYEKSLWEMHKQNREAFKCAMKEAKKTKPNYADLNDRYVDFEFKQAQLFKNYHHQLRKLLAPETLFRYYKAEREFKRKLLQDFQDRRPPERPRPQ